MTRASIGMWALFIAGVWPSGALAAQPARIPFTYVDNRMLVTCVVDGRPFSMIVDTGAPTVAITPEVARTLGLRVRSNGQVTGAGNRSVDLGAATAGSIRLDNASFEKVPVEVLDLSEIRTKLHFPRLDGVVGTSVLQSYAVYVDVDAGTIGLLPSAPPIPKEASSVPFTQSGGGIPTVSARIDGIATTVVIDTGDRSSLTLFAPFAHANGFYGRYPARRNVITGYGLGGPIYADVFRVNSLDVFGRHLDGIPTRASRQTGGAFASALQGGSVGTGLLRRFNVVYDYPHHRISVWPKKERRPT